MSRVSAHSGPLCVVEIGFQRLLMPMSKGLKVMELLQGALEVEHDFDSSREVGYLLGESPRLELASVKANQVRAKPGEPASQGAAVDALSAPRRQRQVLLLPKP